MRSQNVAMNSIFEVGMTCDVVDSIISGMNNAETKFGTLGIGFHIIIGIDEQVISVDFRHDEFCVYFVDAFRKEKVLNDDPLKVLQWSSWWEVTSASIDGASVQWDIVVPLAGLRRENFRNPHFRFVAVVVDTTW